MALKAPSAESIVKFVALAMVILFLITSVININAIGKGTCNLGTTYTTEKTCEAQTGGVWTSADIYNSNVDYDELIPATFKWLIVGMAVIIAWSFVMGFGQPMNRKKLITIIISAIALYYIYQNVLVGLIPGLEPLEFAAYQLQSVM